MSFLQNGIFSFNQRNARQEGLFLWVALVKMTTHYSKPTREEIAHKRVMYNTAGLLAIIREPRGELDKAEDVGPLGTDGTHDAFSLHRLISYLHEVPGRCFFSL